LNSSTAGTRRHQYLFLEKRYYTRAGEVVWALLAVSVVRHATARRSILSPRLKTLTT
jgi:hypothetical protein